MNSVHYEELRPAQFVRRIQEAPVAYLPLGTLEWHGLHLPLGADGLQARGAMKMIAERAGGIVLPMLFLGPDYAEEKDGRLLCGMDVFSFEEGHARQLAGSAYYMEEECFGILLDTAMRNLARAGFKIVVAHGHGPSTKYFAKRREEYLKNYGMQCYTLFDLGFEDENGLMTDHAAANETSITMALHPELVDMDALAADGVPVASWGRDPRKYASAENGRELLESNVNEAVDKLIKIIHGLPKPDVNLEFSNVKNMIHENGE